MTKPMHPGMINLRDRTPEERREIARKGGKANTVAQKFQRNMSWLREDNKLTAEQKHFTFLIKQGNFATAIRDLLMLIASKSKTADDHHKLLSQLMKIPFIEKVYADLYKEKQRDVIPVVVEVLREHGQDELIGILFERLKKAGWGEDARTKDDDNDEVPEVLGDPAPEQPQDGAVAGPLDEVVPGADVLHVQPQSSSSEKSEEEGVGQA